MVYYRYTMIMKFIICAKWGTNITLKNMVHRHMIYCYGTDKWYSAKHNYNGKDYSKE